MKVKWFITEAYQKGTQDPVGLLVVRAKSKQESIERVAQAIHFEKSKDKTYSVAVTRVPAQSARWLIHNAVVASHDAKG